MLNFIFESLCNTLLVAWILIVFSFFYLLHDSLLICLLSNHRISLLQSLNKNINSAVKLSQVVFHVLLLTSFAFRLLVSVELVKSFFLTLGIGGVS